MDGARARSVLWRAGRSMVGDGISSVDKYLTGRLYCSCIC